MRDYPSKLPILLLNGRSFGSIHGHTGLGQSPATFRAVIFSTVPVDSTPTDIGELQQSINSAVMNLVDALLRGESATAFSDLSEELRQKNKPRVMAEQIRLVQQFGPKNAKVQHTYLIKVGKPAANRVVCAGNPRDLNVRVSLSAKDVPEQAHVLISADTVNSQVAFTIWMLPENDKWKVKRLWFNVASLANQGPAQLLETARAQNRSNHAFNAALFVCSCRSGGVSRT